LIRTCGGLCRAIIRLDQYRIEAEKLKMTGKNLANVAKMLPRSGDF